MTLLLIACTMFLGAFVQSEVPQGVASSYAIGADDVLRVTVFWRG